MTGPQDDQGARLEALERQVAALSAEVAALRGHREAESAAWARMALPRGASRSDAQPDTAQIRSAATRMYRRATAGGGAPLTGDQIESFVGRYGTLLLAALVILMAVGVLVEVAVSRGLLTATVRVALGALVAVVLSGAGLHFRRRGEVRYGDVLLSIALATVDLVAWGAGPRLRIVPPSLALVVVDVVSAAIAMLALHDENEFLFAVAVGGALSAPFVTSTGGGTAAMLLAYGAAVVVGAMRVARIPAWLRAFAVLVGGATLYILTATQLPVSATWYGPYVIVLFGGACALASLLTAQFEWRGDLARSFLFVSLIGVMVAWDHASASPFALVAAIAIGLAAVTYLALSIRQPVPEQWVGSALVLPLLSLGVAWPASDARFGAWPAIAVWAAFALAAWEVERRRDEPERSGAHLLAGGLLGALAIVAGLWDYPLPLVAALGSWGIVLSALGRRERTPLPLAAVAVALGAAGALAIDQLASRLAYAYTPFLTRSSASALCATVALAASAELIGQGDGEGGVTGGLERWADRPLRLGIVIGYAILWGRMELAHAFSRDLRTFLLILYYAACGLATILAGRFLGVQRLRMAGLAMALYAAVKAMVEVAGIDGVALRVGAYGAVGLFLLGAGYLYRVRKPAAEPLGEPAPTG